MAGGGHIGTDDFILGYFGRVGVGIADGRRGGFGFEHNLPGKRIGNGVVATLVQGAGAVFYRVTCLQGRMGGAGGQGVGIDRQRLVGHAALMLSRVAHIDHISGTGLVAGKDIGGIGQGKTLAG